MRVSAIVFAFALLISGCGSEAPLVPDPSYNAASGPQVTYHAKRQDGMLVLDGVAQGIDQLSANLVREGKTLKMVPVAIQSQRFTCQVGPVQDGDVVTLSGIDYRATFVMSFPNRVDPG